MKKTVANWLPWLWSSLLLCFSFPPFNFWPLIFIALVPWLKKLEDGDLRYGFWSGYGFGFTYFGFQMFWVIQFVEQWTGNLSLALLPWLVCAFLAGWFYALSGWLMARCYQKGWSLLVPIVWACIEAFRAYIPGLAFPWGNVSLPLATVPVLAQLASVGTMFLVSSWIIVFNQIICSLLSKKGQDRSHEPKLRLFSVGLFTIGLCFTVFRYSVPTSGQNVDFVLGQPGVDMAFTPPEIEHQMLTLAGRTIISENLQDPPDLVIFPEGFGGSVIGDIPATSLGFNPLLPVIFGAHRYESEDSAFQTAFIWDGQEWKFADKTRLVVFGEYVPLRDQIPFLQNFNLPAGDLKAGKNFQTLSLGELKIGQLICFEGVFPDLAVQHSKNGAQVLVQMSIDDWYEKTPAHQQLWMSSIWRSIESGVPLLRVGGRGKSLATDSRGNIIAQIPIGIQKGERVTVKVPQASDAFPLRFWFTYGTWAVGLLIFVGFFSERIRNSRATS